MATAFRRAFSSRLSPVSSTASAPFGRAMSSIRPSSSSTRMVATSRALSGFAVAMTKRILISAPIAGIGQDSGPAGAITFEGRGDEHLGLNLEDLVDAPLGKGQHLVELGAGERQAF